MNPEDMIADLDANINRGIRIYRARMERSHGHRKDLPLLSVAVGIVVRRTFIWRHRLAHLEEPAEFEALLQEFLQAERERKEREREAEERERDGSFQMEKAVDRLQLLMRQVKRHDRERERERERKRQRYFRRVKIQDECAKRGDGEDAGDELEWDELMCETDLCSEGNALPRFQGLER